MRIILSFILCCFLLVTLNSCEKSEGCSDFNALNFTSNAEPTNNDLCQYSTVVFYASGNTFFGEKVTEIELTLGQTNMEIGLITSFNQPYPGDCTVPGTLQYHFQSGDKQFWFATFNLLSGGVVSSQGEISPDSSNDCVKVDLLP